MTGTILIDLAEYDMAGMVEMGVPSQRNLTMRDNALGNCTVSKMVNGEPIIVETRIGDAEMIRVLTYVRKAPFNNTVKSFLDFCDRMEPGKDTALFDRMRKAKETIEGEMSPFADSQEAETETSD